MSLLYEMKKTCLTKGENIYLCALFFFPFQKRETECRQICMVPQEFSYNIFQL